jgi:hypothetical protein
MQVDTYCSQTGREIKLVLDSDLDLIEIDPESDPMISIPLVNLIKTDQPSIVDIF